MQNTITNVVICNVKFVLRVYGIWIREGQILISREKIKSFAFVKFPGGGVEPGEGIKEALLRELEEETGMDRDGFQVTHFYTTDFFQVSAFNPTDQIVSIYYLIETAIQPPVFEMKYELPIEKEHSIYLEWIPLTSLEENLLTFPIDKHVSGMIRARFSF